MSDKSLVEEFDQRLARWRDSCIFYFKLDVAMVAATAAMASFFRLEGDALVEEVARYKSALQFLMYLALYALVFELCITTVRNRPHLALEVANDRVSVRYVRVFSAAYTLQVLGHLFLVWGVIAYVSGYISGFMVYHP